MFTGGNFLGTAAKAGPYDRPTGLAGQSRSVVVARNGIVATSQPLAAQAGLAILQAGGNAADGAIAANAMLGVVEPMSCGLGGDLFAIYWDAKTKKLYGLNASGRSPYKLSRAVLAERGIRDHIPGSGPLSWSVPGCASGWMELRKRFGSRPLAELLAPAVRTAEEGFGVTEVIASHWQGSAGSLKAHDDSAATFLVEGRGPRFGELFRNPRLAATYSLLAKEGEQTLYQGEIARKIVAFSERHGGYFSAADFADHAADWVEPVSTTYRGYEVWELPPNGQGISVLQMLNLLEQHDLAALGRGSPEVLHLLVEAKKLAYADRARFYADPAFEKIPTAELISKKYAAERGRLIDRNRAADEALPGAPPGGDTVYLTVVDKDRNCCSLIQSNYAGFGSQMVPGDLGFALQNRGCLFSLDEHHPNRLEPHKRPFHTIIPAMVTKEGKPCFCFGVMGGDMQPQGHVQVLMNLIDFGLNVQQAGDAPRVRHDGSATPTGQKAAGKGVVVAESGISDAALDALRGKGHTVVRGQGGMGGYQGIWIDWKTGLLHGGTEARLDGAAVGY